MNAKHLKIWHLTRSRSGSKSDGSKNKGQDRMVVKLNEKCENDLKFKLLDVQHSNDERKMI